MHLLAAIKIRKNMIFLRTRSHILPSLQVLVALLCQSQLFSPEKKTWNELKSVKTGDLELEREVSWAAYNAYNGDPWSRN